MNEIQQEALQVLVKLTLVSLRGGHRVSEDECVLSASLRDRNDPPC